MTETIKWLGAPEDYNYPAAESYLSLIMGMGPIRVGPSIIDQLKNAKVVAFKAKDIFRASGLSLLGVNNFHVKKTIKKIESGKLLSPILLVCDTIDKKLIIADGYHRLC